MISRFFRTVSRHIVRSMFVAGILSILFVCLVGVVVGEQSGHRI
jgi:hypothetical protein